MSSINCVYAGAASRPPCALRTISCGLSNPIQTPATMSGVKPMNQTLVPSLVVPVLPPDGSVKPPLQTDADAVPLVTTPWSARVMVYATEGETTSFICGVDR